MKAFQFIKEKSVGTQIEEIYSATHMYIAQRVGERGFLIDFSKEPDRCAIMFEKDGIVSAGTLKRIYISERGFCVDVCFGNFGIEGISLEDDVYCDSLLSIAKAIEKYKNNHKELVWRV